MGYSANNKEAVAAAIAESYDASPQATADARDPKLSSRVFEGEPISMVVVTEDFPDLSKNSLDLNGFEKLLCDERVSEQVKTALGEYYQRFAVEQNYGTPYYFSYDAANAIYYAEGSVFAWEITQYGAIRFAFTNYAVAGELDEARIWEFTNTIEQVSGEEMKSWLERQNSIIEQTANIYSQMDALARE